MISPPPWWDDEESNGSEESGLTLPPPPRVPRGRRNSLSTFLSQLATPVHFNPFPIAPTSLSPIVSQERDPNAFYYKPTPPSSPKESFSLECQQWRHETTDEYFAVDLFVENCPTEATGAVECVVHAENLSTPTKKLIKVNIRLTRASTFDYARALVGKFQC